MASCVCPSCMCDEARLLYASQNRGFSLIASRRRSGRGYRRAMATQTTSSPCDEGVSGRVATALYTSEIRQRRGWGGMLSVRHATAGARSCALDGDQNPPLFPSHHAGHHRDCAAATAPPRLRRRDCAARLRRATTPPPPRFGSQSCPHNAPHREANQTLR